MCKAMHVRSHNKVTFLKSDEMRSSRMMMMMMMIEDYHHHYHFQPATIVLADSHVDIDVKRADFYTGDTECLSVFRQQV